MSDTNNPVNAAPSASRCSTVSQIDFLSTVAHLSVAEQALLEESYERLPYLAGTLAVAQQHMETLRKEATRLRSALSEIVKIDYTRAATNCAAYDAVQIAKEALRVDP